MWDINDLIGETINVFEERISEDNFDENTYESVTWTFYTIRTVKTSIDITWRGTSNGWYSERVDIDLLNCEEFKRILSYYK